MDGWMVGGKLATAPSDKGQTAGKCLQNLAAATGVENLFRHLWAHTHAIEEASVSADLRLRATQLIDARPRPAISAPIAVESLSLCCRTMQTNREKTMCTYAVGLS